METKKEIERFYTKSKRSSVNKGDKVDLLTADTRIKTYYIKLNANPEEIKGITANGEEYEFHETSRFAFDFVISVLKREGYAEVTI